MIPALVVDAIAVHRLTRLLTRDKVTEPIREAWIGEMYERADREPPRPYVPEGDPPPSWAAALEFDRDPPRGAYFISCPWCVGLWCAAAVVVARRLVPSLWDPLARALVMSDVAGVVESYID